MILKPRLVLVHADDRIITAAFLEAEGGNAIDLTEWMGAFTVEHENAGTSEVILRFPGCEIEHVHPAKPSPVEVVEAALRTYWSTEGAEWQMPETRQRRMAERIVEAQRGRS